MSLILGAWLACGLTACILSFLYRDNPLFKIAEHLYIGVTAGYSLTVVIFNVWFPNIVLRAAEGDLFPLVPALAGVLILGRLSPAGAWLSRIGFSFVLGYGAGLAASAAASSMKPTTIFFAKF